MVRFITLDCIKPNANGSVHVKVFTMLQTVVVFSVLLYTASAQVSLMKQRFYKIDVEIIFMQIFVSCSMCTIISLIKTITRRRIKVCNSHFIIGVICILYYARTVNLFMIAALRTDCCLSTIIKNYMHSSLSA